MYFVPNISITSAAVGGTVESQSRPMATPKTRAVVGDGGRRMKTMMATARPR